MKTARHRWKFEVAPAPCDLGLGLFALRDFKAGELLFTFEGPLVGLEQAVAMGEREANVLQVAPQHYIDLQPPGIFANHSCEPNAGIRNDVEAIALREIRVGQEICFDYSTTMSERRWTMQCLCGTASCRGLVTDFHELPETLRERYLSLGIVQRFIVEELRVAKQFRAP